MYGDHDAELFRQIYPRLRRFAAVVGPASTEPDDLVQEAVARALRRGALHELDQPLAYLRRTIANLASNERRRGVRRWSALVRVGLQSPTPAAYPSDLSALDQLSARERGAVYLHEIEGLSFGEVADLLGCSAEAARQAASRGRRRLQVASEEHV